MSSLTLSAAISLGTAMLAAFLALPLLALARQRPATAWLAGLVFCLGALSFCDSWVLRIPLFGLFDWPVAAMGAFYYCYVRALTGFGNGARQALHFVPALAAAAVFAWLHRERVALPDGVYPTLAWGRVWQAVVVASQAVTVAYMVAVLWRLRQHRRRVRECYSATADRDLRWLAWLTAASLALLMAWLPATALGGAWSDVLRDGRVLLLCFIGWYGLRQAPVFVPAIGTAPAAAAPVVVVAPDPISTASPERAKYARSGMTRAAEELIAVRLAQRMDVNRDYLEPDITLAQLADRIGASPQWLSQYLNHVQGESFFDYINGLRVAEVQRVLRESGETRRPLLELAFAAGFNSKSTFNAAFKKRTGSAPSAWRSAHVVAASGPIG